MVDDRSSSSSSGEDDGDADWRAAIDSVAATTTFSSTSRSNHKAAATTNSVADPTHEDRLDNHGTQQLKHYQIKAQKLLDAITEKTIEIVRDSNHVLHEDPSVNGGGIRLFKHAPLGIVFDHVDELQGPTKKPKIVPGEDIDERSEKFRWQLQSVAVDGTDIMAAARVACKKSLAKLEAREAAIKAAVEREQKRVAELKKIRGERWLPSVARDMQANGPRY